MARTSGRPTDCGACATDTPIDRQTHHLSRLTTTNERHGQPAHSLTGQPNASPAQPLAGRQNDELTDGTSDWRQRERADSTVDATRRWGVLPHILREDVRIPCVSNKRFRALASEAASRANQPTAREVRLAGGMGGHASGGVSFPPPLQLDPPPPLRHAPLRQLVL